MRLGDLLIRAKLITEEDVAKALERMAAHGGRLGDNLVAIGALDRQACWMVSSIAFPPSRPDIAATGIDENDLMALLLKTDLRRPA